MEYILLGHQSTHREVVNNPAIPFPSGTNNTHDPEGRSRIDSFTIAGPVTTGSVRQRCRMEAEIPAWVFQPVPAARMTSGGHSPSRTAATSSSSSVALSMVLH